MLQPKRTRYRKQMKGRNRGMATRGDGVGFGAGAFGEGGVLDVTARVHAPDLVEERRADLIVRIRRVRVAARVRRRFE